MSYIPANYDNWLTKPYDDLCDKESSVDYNCAEHHEDEEDWACDYEGYTDVILTKSESGRRWWENTYEGKCPKCGASFTKTEGDSDDGDDW